jgi:hypothetical protein
MSDRLSDRAHVPARQFVPDVNPLEGRCLLSQTVVFPDGHIFIFPTISLPRTGGVAVQTGAVLSIAVAAKPTSSTLQITDDGAGDVTAEWDGGPVHTFHGVLAIVAEVEGRRSETVDVSLTGPLTEPLDIAVTLHGKTNAITARLSGYGPNLPVLVYHVVGPGNKHTEVTIE